MSSLYKIFGLAILIGLMSSGPASPADPLNDWKSLEANAGLCKAKKDYKQASHLFHDAAALAEKSQLPTKYREIALCRETEADVLSGEILIAESHLTELLKLVKANKCSPVESDLAIWMVDLAKTYQNYPNPNKRFGCLERACSICELTYGRERKGFWDAMSMLADYYVDSGQIEKAVKVFAQVTDQQEKRFGKNPRILAGLLFQEAVRAKIKHMYAQTQQLAMRTIELADKEPDLKGAIPVSYLLLSMNAYAQDKSDDGQRYFGQSIDKSKFANTPAGRKLATDCLQLLLIPCGSDMEEKRYALAEQELKEVLRFEKLVSKNSNLQYQILSVLAGLLPYERKFHEGAVYMTEALNIAKQPNSGMSSELPDLYMRLGIYKSDEDKLNESNEMFAQALKLEREPRGYHAGLVLLRWGEALRNLKCPDIALEKLKSAKDIAAQLPASNRGTVLADALSMLSEIYTQKGSIQEAKSLSIEASTEIAFQRKLGTKLGPDCYSRL